MIEVASVVSLLALLVAGMALVRVRALSARLRQLESGMRPIPATKVEPPDAPAPQAASTPWSRRKAAPQPLDEPSTTPAPERAPAAPSRLAEWLKANWIYPVAGAALVMAAVYLLQYSVERGLLSPSARIGMALALGAALVGGALWLRRRWGEGESGAALVPATLAGAGIVTLFAAILAAHHLYQMIEQTATLTALSLVAALAIGLGWSLGPLLAGLGILGAVAAPFLLVGTGTTPEGLYAYFGVVAGAGLLIDSLRRWGWVSALAVVAPMAGGILLRLGGAGPLGLSLLALAILALAMALPGGTLVPRQVAGPRRALVVPALATVLALGAILLLVPAPLAIWALGAAAVLLPIWCRNAPALDRIGQATAAAMVAGLVAAPFLTSGFVALVLPQQPALPFLALGLAALVALVHAWRSEAGARGWALSGLATPFAATLAIEIFWNAPRLVGPMAWALASMAQAGLFTALALAFARRDAGQGLRLGSAVVGAFAMIALSLFTLLGGAALSVALAVLMVVSAALDRQRNLPELGALVGAGTMVLAWRLLVDPGPGWVFDRTTPALEVWLALAATLLGPLVSLALLAGQGAQRVRDWGRVVAETGFFSLLAVAAGVVIARFLPAVLAPHAAVGLQGAVLIALAWAQVQRNARLDTGRVMRGIRRVLAWIFGLAGAVLLLIGVTVLSPVLGDEWLAGSVQGLPVLNDLLLALALPALVLALATRGAPGRIAQAGRIGAGALAALWAATALRHLWRGDAGMPLSHGFFQGELYSYTVALLLAGAAAMGLALHWRSRGWRLFGLAIIGAAALKAFLVDASGLEGLLRAGAFLGLGLSLAGLAWLNGWVAARTRGASGKGDA